MALQFDRSSPFRSAVLQNWNYAVRIHTNSDLSTKVIHFECLALKTQIPENHEEKTTTINTFHHSTPVPWFFRPESNDLLIQPGGTFYSRKSQQHYIATLLLTKGKILHKCIFDTLVDLHPKYWSHANTDLKKIEKLPHCSSALLWTSLLHRSSISYQTFQNSRIYLNSTPDDSVASVNVFRRFRTDNIRRSVW